MTGYELRRHLEHAHQEATRGWAYDDMAALHAHLHQDSDAFEAAAVDHDHHHPQ